MYTWAALNKLTGLSKKKKGHKVGSGCVRGSFGELEGGIQGLCDHVSLYTYMEFSRVK